jgi:16S rRNA (guanine(966)-N(2))-methyltransferase RsmD
MGARVLDLYAGTGALGLEALSRGAEEAVFVDSAAPALRALADNIEQLDLRHSTRVLSMPVQRAVKRLIAEGPFDLVFIDPPYAQVVEAMAELAPLVQSPTTLAPGVRVVLEHASRTPPPRLDGFAALPPRVYGDTAVTIYRRAGLDGQRSASLDSASSSNEP